MCHHNADMGSDDHVRMSSAIQDFRRARMQAEMQGLMGRLTGRSNTLLNYDDVRRQLKAVESSARVRKVIPLDNIVGSVGRYRDFTRTFLPKHDSDEQRWAGVKAAMTSLQGVPPIEVYQIDDVYFVRDGNHRVSVARQFGAKDIEAYVTPVHTDVPLEPNTKPDELIIRGEYASFLQDTDLADLRPDADLTVTAPGKYEQLLEHIHVHQYYMGLDFKRDVPYQEAVTHWYDTVYLPIKMMIRERNLLKTFPDRTETDLYLWLAEYRAELEQDLDWELRPEAVAEDLAERFGQRRQVRRSQIQNSILENSPSPTKAQMRRDAFICDDVLVPISGTPMSWQALEQALIVAHRENARLYGLHIVQNEGLANSSDAQAIKAKFEQRCQEMGVFGNLAVEVGEVVPTLSTRARWTDLVVANLAYPPARNDVARVSQGFQPLLRRSNRPVLATPGTTTNLNSALVAYNGTPKSNVGLFAAAYGAVRWGTKLRILTIQERGRSGENILANAKVYLEKLGINAQYQLAEGAVVATILEAAETYRNDLLIVGGYEYSMMLEPLLGGVIDELLRQSRLPMLICQ